MLPAFAAEHGLQAYCLSIKICCTCPHSAANQPYATALWIDETDKQTDGQPTITQMASINTGMKQHCKSCQFLQYSTAQHKQQLLDIFFYSYIVLIKIHTKPNIDARKNVTYTTVNIQVFLYYVPTFLQCFMKSCNKSVHNAA